MSGMRRASRRGFTLIELLVVLAIMGTLLTIALPRYLHSVARSREAVLHEDLHVMRTAIDHFLADSGRYPASLAELVERRYLRKLPDADAYWRQNRENRVAAEFYLCLARPRAYCFNDCPENLYDYEIQPEDYRR